MAKQEPKQRGLQKLANRERFVDPIGRDESTLRRQLRDTAHRLQHLNAQRDKRNTLLNRSAARGATIRLNTIRRRFHALPAIRSFAVRSRQKPKET